MSDIHANQGRRQVDAPATLHIYTHLQVEPGVRWHSESQQMSVSHMVPQSHSSPSSNTPFPQKVPVAARYMFERSHPLATPTDSPVKQEDRVLRSTASMRSLEHGENMLLLACVPSVA